MHCNCICNCGICIAPPTERPRTHHKAIISLYPGVWRQTGTKMLPVGDKKRRSTAAASAVSAACSMLAVRQQRKPCRHFVDVNIPYHTASYLCVCMCSCAVNTANQLLTRPDSAASPDSMYTDQSLHKRCSGHACQQWTHDSRRTCTYLHTDTHSQLFNGPLSGNTRVGRYQKKHPPTHIHTDYQTSTTNLPHWLF